MPRVVSLFLPHWSTDRYKKRSPAASGLPDKPLVLVGHIGRRRVVVAADLLALKAGLRPGMAATQAQAMVKELALEDTDPDGDREALERLALWALRRYSPIVAADPPDGLVVDLTGAAHLHGGEDAMASGLIERLAGAGFSARIAIADSWGAAHALARFVARPAAIVEPGQSAAAVLGLPIAALRLSSDIVDGLRTLGFDTIGSLTVTPRAPLTLRFGPELGRRIDQVLGIVAEPIEPLRPDDVIEVRQAFGEPIGAAETIARYIGKLVAALVAELEPRDLGVRRLDLLFQRVDAGIEAIRVGTAMPTRDAKRLTKMLVAKVETIDPGFGIELMQLAATLAEPLDPKQTISSLVEAPETDIAALIDIIANRVGEERLYRFSPVASDVPERSVVKVGAAAVESGASWPAHWPRPSRLLGTPEPIETVALLPDHPPVVFTWRGMRRRVRRADGPERVFGEWWKRDAELAAVRDYFQVEDEAGERFWLFRRGDGEDGATGSQLWFLHGIFG